jgi:hypothetical protein
MSRRFFTAKPTSVTDPMETTLEEGQVLSEEAYQNALNEFGPNFKASMGGDGSVRC